MLNPSLGQPFDINWSIHTLLIKAGQQSSHSQLEGTLYCFSKHSMQTKLYYREFENAFLQSLKSGIQMYSK